MTANQKAGPGRPKLAQTKAEDIAELSRRVRSLPPAPVPEKPRVGRNPSISAETIQKLESAYSYGCTDGEACIYAGISQGTLYNYQKAHPEFIERKNLLRNLPYITARQAVIRSFPERPEIAMRYLENKLPEEFSPKMKHAHEGELKINYSAELSSRLKKYEPEVSPPDVPGMERRP